MCKAFSCIVLKSGEVKWKMGVDSHSDLEREFGLRDSTADVSEMQFAKVEIAPANGNYLHPDKWVFNLDEARAPEWWTPIDEKSAKKAHSEWKRQIYKIVQRKPIVHPFEVKPLKKISARHLAGLKKWASVRNSVWASVWDSVGNSVWDSVWASVWASVWTSVGNSVWASVRNSVGNSVGTSVGTFGRDFGRDFGQGFGQGFGRGFGLGLRGVVF